MHNWFLIPSVCLLFVSCGTRSLQEASPVSVPVEVQQSYSAFKANNYPATSESYRNEELLARTNAENSSIRVSLSLQRAFLMNGGEVAMDYPISTGKYGHATPPGSYTILERISDKRSNLYGKVYDASGQVVDSSANSRTAEIPAGGKFVGAAMPYWMRLTWTGIGMHVGRVPRYPASHGCIRGQSWVVPIIYSKVKNGTQVEVVQ